MRSRVRFENDLCAYLEAKGYYCIRSAGSRGPADVYAINHQHIRMIQLKTTVSLERKGNISVFADAIEYLRTFPCPPNATQELWVKPLRRNWIYTVVSDMEAQTRDEIRRALHAVEWIDG
jgi:Holliday junction resolvase